MSRVKELERLYPQEIAALAALLEVCPFNDHSERPRETHEFALWLVSRGVRVSDVR